MQIASTLAVAALLQLLASTIGLILGIAYSWIRGRRPYNSSVLPPACSAGDSSYDWTVDGWWFDDPEPDAFGPWGARLTRRIFQGRQQFLLSHEQVTNPSITIQHVLAGARV